MRFRFCEADRAKYGGDWHEIDPNAVDDLRFTAGLIERWEDATGYTIMVTLAAGLLRGEHRAVRALMWLAAIVDGSEVEWADFWPNVRATEMERKAGEGEGNSSRPRSRATTGTGRSTGRRSANTSTTTS